MVRSAVSFCELQHGEKVGLTAIEITAIPHVSILQKRYSTVPNIDLEYKQDMARLLSEVYQNYKVSAGSTDGCKEIALELLWCTEEVGNQPYRAKIRLFLNIRAIDNTEENVIRTISNLARICIATLDFQKYEYRNVSAAELTQCTQRIGGTGVKALVKDERLENLHNPILPTCYAFARLPITENDLSRVTNCLTGYPNCAVSFQLMPVMYSPDESDILGKMAQALDNLNKGLMEQGVGSVSFTLAERHADTYKYYSKNKNAALFSYNILVMGPTEAIDSIATIILGQLNIGHELRIIPLTANEVQKDTNLHPLPWAANELLMGRERNPYVWNNAQNLNAFYRLPFIITAQEASEFFRLPVGSENVSAGLVVNESSKSSRSYASNIIGGGDIEIGKLKASSKGDTIGISLRDLTKHMLIVGTPGSGKTTFSVSLLDRLWKDYKIPFLVIEPAKSEYRALVQSIPDLQVFTPGKNFISPFVFNPFVPPTNVKLETYKFTLKTAFAAAVSMSTPLDKIFEESVNNCYAEFRWLDTYTSNDRGQAFNIADFIKCFEETFEQIGYTGDAKNIGRAGVVRLTSLVNLFDNYFSIPIEDLLTKPTIIELAAIENSDQKALIISLLLLSILAYVNSNYVGEGSLRNVILLEEAHVLLDANANTTEQGEANPSAIAQGLVKRMLAEIRSYGVGIVIADQSPRKVTTDVVALTDIKLAFRLVEASDKQIIADSTNMEEVHIRRLGKLKPGEAFLFFAKLDEPEEIRTEDYRLAKNINITLSDDAIKQLTVYWNDKRDKLRPYPECAHCPYCREDCNLSRRALGKEIARRLFVKNIKHSSASFAVVKNVLGQISKLIKDELNDEVFDRELLSCVKVHLFRRIKYGTKISIPMSTVQTSLEKV